VSRQLVLLAREAARYCRRTPLRTTLAALCVALSATGAGGAVVYVRTLAAQVSRAVSALGVDVLIVAPRIDVAGRGRGLDSGKAQTLDIAEFREMSRLLPPLAEVGATRSQSFLVKAGPVSRNATTVVGVSANFADIRDLQPGMGRFLLPEDQVRLTRVAVLGAAVARDLFGTEPAVGQRIFINRVAFDVVGLLTESGQSIDGGAMDVSILVPLDVALRRLSNSSYLSSVVIRINDESRADAIADSVTDVLRRRHHPIGRAPVDYELLRERDVRAGAAATARKLQVYGWSVGTGVLVIGALGVVAIQTLGLAERRREFGLRRALGASSQDLAVQLLTETIIVCIYGTVCGLTVLAASLRWLEWARGLRPVNEMVPWLSAAVAVSFAINVGCILWPLLHEARRPPHAALTS
jgi:putative ABC transport system permease protein